MNNLVVNGKQKFMGKEIPVVLGGFGKGKKCICDKTIAEIHDMGAFKARERILSNISRFRENIDFIDLKQGILVTDTSENQRVGETEILELLQELGYAKQSITQAEHIYLLSERGYAKLIKIMDTDLAWEIHDRLIDEYFELRERVIESEKPRLETVNDTVKILTNLLKKAGCSPEVQLLTAKTLIEQNTGIVLPITIQSDKQYYDTEYIARKVGIYVKSSGKPAEKAVNEIIRRLNISDDMYTETWESVGKWQGTVRKYSKEVIDMINEWCVENDYPADIEYAQTDGKKKKYHVKWKEIPNYL